ncbi:MAG TPA: TIGR03118 family protein [Candidatus Aquilonibacter sp.]|jgi:uncharacterized protein (TIGR03118 family)|nr:TIGR03118 family protein [Candidatus Aquilonibacter sp.]
MPRFINRGVCLASFIALVFMLAPSMAAAQYKLVNLVSNQSGAATHIDPLLVNGWGLAYGPTGPFWVSDNGSGWSTLYTGAGVKQGLQVLIPTAGGNGPGSPTGIVFNGSQDFQVQGWPSIFLFATLDGTISGWAPQSNLNAAIVAVTTPGAVYTGLAVTSNPSGNFLFAADNANNKVDVYDGTFTLVTSFTDATLPAGFAPFGIQDFGGLVYVAFASTSGASGGYIDIYSEGGVFLKRLAQGAPLNQPWGFAIAPKDFGTLSNTLLVANNTNSGTINAFNSVTGQLVGTVRDNTGKDIIINQLWGIEFGGGTANNGSTNQLFFTAGPDNNLAGTFGRIELQ